MKMGIIRCAQTEEFCPASNCLKYMRERKGAFQDINEDIICVGINTCGGCPGKKAGLRAANMVKKAGAEAIAIASCIRLGTPINFPCPFGKKLEDAVREAVGENIKIFDYTHEPANKKDTKLNEKC